MLLGQLFHIRMKPEKPSAPRLSVSEGAVQAATQQIYVVFLNDYVANGFNEIEGERKSQSRFYAEALEYSRMTGTSQLEASGIAENQRQRARRNYQQIMELAESVLVDQRNYLLACLINARASAVGCAVQSRPYSGTETLSGQPCHAFALKLMADASLGRGMAKGLQEDAVTMLEHHIAHRAESEVQEFLIAFEEEEGELP